MKRPGMYHKGAVDALSALFLFVAMLMAGGYGHVAASAPSILPASRTAPADAGTGGQRSVPVLSIPKSYFSESDEATQPSSDDGKSKALVPALLLPPLASVEKHDGYSVFVGFALPRAASFSARAPPPQS